MFFLFQKQWKHADKKKPSQFDSFFFEKKPCIEICFNIFFHVPR